MPPYAPPTRDSPTCRQPSLRPCFPADNPTTLHRAVHFRRRRHARRPVDELPQVRRTVGPGAIRAKGLQHHVQGNTMSGEMSSALGPVGHLPLAPCLAGLRPDNNCLATMVRTMRLRNIFRVPMEAARDFATAHLKRTLSFNRMTHCMSLRLHFTTTGSTRMGVRDDVLYVRTQCAGDPRGHLSVDFIHRRDRRRDFWHSPAPPWHARRFPRRCMPPAPLARLQRRALPLERVIPPIDALTSQAAAHVALSSGFPLSAGPTPGEAPAMSFTPTVIKEWHPLIKLISAGFSAKSQAALLSFSPMNRQSTVQLLLGSSCSSTRCASAS